MSQLSPTSKSSTASSNSPLSFKSAQDEEVNGSEYDEPRRRNLPVTQPDKVDSNLWSFLKNCIGRELSKITMPVQWNEPISFLQRLSEYMNYAYLLKLAAEQEEAETRMLFVSTFAVSALASNFERMGKPFNPLLGETYELKRKDFKIVCEQVGHHPPVSAFYADNDDKDFVFRGSMQPKVKFWGKSIEFQPKGTCTVELPKKNETYTWSNVNCVIHNIIVGSLWMEQQGTMEIKNHSTGHRCVLSFRPGGWFSGHDDLHTVEGFLIDANKVKKKFIYGKWTEFLCATNISEAEKFFGTKIEKIDDKASNLPKHEPLTMGAIPHSSVLWRADPKDDDSNKYYNFSTFTMALNEISNSSKHCCPTDSRRRPDIRALENGDLDGASKDKERLENKQREYRKPYKSAKKESDWWKPRWFEPSQNEHSKEPDWKYVGGYWDRKYENVPDIF